jgi:hypothetical protein
VSHDKPKDLRLVKPKPPSGEEIDRAAEALRAALAPRELPAADHEALLALVLGDDAAEVGDGERAAADRFRAALETGAPHPLSELASALRAVHQPAPPPEADHEVILAAALTLDVSPDREAERLREALAGRGQHPFATFAGVLVAAHRPAALVPEDGEALISLALGSEAAVGAHEREEATRLCGALAGQGSHPLVPWATALRVASERLGGIDAVSHERLLRRTMESARARPGALLGALVAVAAAVALFVGSWDWRDDLSGPAPMAQQAAPVPLVRVRSTQELFDPTVPFDARGGESERMERIVAARAADLRANRFAAWGVR